MPIDLQSKIAKMRRATVKAKVRPRPKRRPRRVNKSAPVCSRISTFLAVSDLTQAEREQAWRIIQSRKCRDEQEEMAIEAVDVVVADRRVGDLVCHGGEEDVL